jgi:predicted neuraminidase
MNFLQKSTTLFITLFSSSLGFYACTNSQESTETTQEQFTPITGIRDYLFQEGEAFPQCHASTLVRTDEGHFVIAWFGGTKEKDDDVGIWLVKGRPGQWSAPQEVAKIREDPHWNPVLHRDNNGKIYLFFKVGKEISHWETWVQTSDDNGDTWSEAYELVKGDKGGRGPVKNKMIELSDGTWLAGASVEPDRWETFVDRSTDGGKTWTASNYFPIDTNERSGKGAIQPTLWESEPGKVHMLIRTGGGVIARSDSEDYGKTWTPIYKTDMPNPNSGIDLTKLPDGTLALTYNPDNKNWGSRSPLKLALSYDNGKTWPDQIDLDKSEEKDEYSYPAIISWGDSIASTYTWNRKTIALWLGTKQDVANNRQK